MEVGLGTVVNEQAACVLPCAAHCALPGAEGVVLCPCFRVLIPRLGGLVICSVSIKASFLQTFRWWQSAPLISLPGRVLPGETRKEPLNGLLSHGPRYSYFFLPLSSPHVTSCSSGFLMGWEAARVPLTMAGCGWSSM